MRNCEDIFDTILSFLNLRALVRLRQLNKCYAAEMFKRRWASHVPIEMYELVEREKLEKIKAIEDAARKLEEEKKAAEEAKKKAELEESMESK